MVLKNIDGQTLKMMFQYGAAYLEMNKKIVDDLNVFPVPDGDTGTNMSLTFSYAAQEVERNIDDILYNVAQTASSGALMGARGNSGVILSQLLRGFAKGCKGKKHLDIYDLSSAFKSASDMAYKAVMKPTEGTILTVARGMAEFCISKKDEYNNIEEFIKDMIQYGKEVLDTTPEMLPVLKEAGVVDAGGKGLIFIIEGAYKALIGEELEIVKDVIDIEKDGAFQGFINDEDIEFGYCTEFIIISKDMNADVIKFRDELTQLGDSIVVVSDEDKIKVHVHTNNPGIVIEKGLNFGQLTRIKIENMREQHSNRVVSENISTTQEIKEYGFIAVSPGEGLSRLFIDLGVDEIIQGGQTMNPSTQDFIEKVNKINAKNIIILPNNSNIILAANQAKEISEKNVEVISTKSIPQGISSLLAFVPEASFDENIEKMNDSILNVKSGQVTFAVRDTQANGKEIKKDNYIGIYNGEINSVGEDKYSVAMQLIEQMVDEDSELISLYYGSDISETEINELSQMLEDKYEDFDIEVHDGGQPLYYFIISVE